MISTAVVFGRSITFEGGGSNANGANLSSNAKFSSASKIVSSMIVTLNDSWRFALLKVESTSRFSAIIS